MKRILFILSSVVLLASCQKKHCWVCTTEYNGIKKESDKVCDRTKAEIEEGFSGGAWDCQKVK